MHLGQTASFLAEVLGRPEATVRMVSRLLREGGWIQTGPRGRNAPHVSSLELANFLIALMCSPDSPAAAVERLTHFSRLPLDSESGEPITFSRGVAILLERLASEDWERAHMKGWQIAVQLDMSSGVIRSYPEGDDEEGELHFFSALKDIDDDEPPLPHLPYFGGLEVLVRIGHYSLYRVAKVVLQNIPDPVVEIHEGIKTKI